VPGQESGHEGSPPVGFTWGSYVLAFVDELGGWAALADELSRRAVGVPGFPSDLQVVEKGIRRLSRREHKSGGQYGGWMVRHFGVPASLARWAQWMGQFHSRFADLPASLRLQQLGLWERPPLTETRAAAWIHVGMASVLTRLQQDDDAVRRLDMAARVAEQAGVACQIEVALMRAKLATDEGKRDQAESLFNQADAWLGSDSLGLEDRRCYHARLVGQRAYHLTRPHAGSAEDLGGALALFESIEDDPFVPFVAFRKCNGLAYCHWKLGDPDQGAAYARLAEQHAGDGGFVRFRIMALNLLARMLPDDQSEAVRRRAETLAKLLEDEDLLRRLRVRWG
jgi:hypothetical protein